MEDTIINLAWGLFFLLVVFSLNLLAYYLFGKLGIFIWIALASILANIQVTKTIELFGFAATLGNIFYGTIFLSTDILTERYGKKEAKKSIYVGFFVNLVTLVVMQMAIFFIPFEGVDIAQGSLETIFNMAPKIILGSLAAYAVSQLIDIFIFDKLKKKTKNKKMWLRNNVATIISQLVDTTIFVFIAFSFDFPINIVVEIFFTTFILKMVVAFLDTPFLYCAKKIKPGLIIQDQEVVSSLLQ